MPHIIYFFMTSCYLDNILLVLYSLLRGCIYPPHPIAMSTHPWIHPTEPKTRGIGDTLANDPFPVPRTLKYCWFGLRRGAILHTRTCGQFSVWRHDGGNRRLGRDSMKDMCANRTRPPAVHSGGYPKYALRDNIFPNNFNNDRRVQNCFLASPARIPSKRRNSILFVWHCRSIPKSSITMSTMWQKWINDALSGTWYI